jgi:hypothetical protein
MLRRLELSRGGFLHRVSFVPTLLSLVLTFVSDSFVVRYILESAAMGPIRKDRTWKTITPRLLHLKPEDEMR